MKRLAASNWIKRVVTLSAVSNTYTPNVDNAEVGFINTPSNNFTVANPTGTPSDGQQLIIRVLCGATPYSITWGAAYVNTSVTLPANGVASKTITVGLMYDATAGKWACLASDVVGY